MLGDNHRLWKDCRKNALVAENGRRYRASNASGKLLSCYKVDGGLIQDGRRCDFALTVNCDSKVYFIELKGGDISHAADQIQTTITNLNIKLKNVVIFARIVCTHVSRPNIRRPQLIRLEQLVAQTTGNVRVSSQELAEDI